MQENMQDVRNNARYTKKTIKIDGENVIVGWGVALKTILKEIGKS